MIVMTHTFVTPSPSLWQLFVDGASRNNPGPSGAGVYILKNGEPYHSNGYYLGFKTNNQAEYLALLCGLSVISLHASAQDKIIIASDSELMIKQLTGVYRVKHENIRPLFEAAQRLLKNRTYSVKHVLRHLNTEADRLANDGVDTKRPVPGEVKVILQPYGIDV